MFTVAVLWGGFCLDARNRTKAYHNLNHDFHKNSQKVGQELQGQVNNPEGHFCEDVKANEES